MKENKDSGSILFSRVLVWVFGALLLVLDWAIWPVSHMLTRYLPILHSNWDTMLIACLYACNVPGFVLIFCMDKLLRNLRQRIVFDSRNVRLLGIVSICCFIACAVCLVGCARIFFLGFVALAAGFVGLIVRIVKNVFSAAIDMRSELDLTV